MEQSAAASGPRYRAFISYSHQDQIWAQWLHKALESYRVPSRLVGKTTAAGVIPARLIPVFRDRDELPSATDLSGKVNEALAQSAAMIVICSPRSAASRWVNEEVLAFKRMAHAHRIFCLIVDGEPNASDIPNREAEECFAPALRFQVGADGQPTRERTEPIAADARAGKDGKANAKLKLISGLLDVGFDALKQREQQRRNRRMAAVTALALLVMVVTTILAVTAVIARADAERRQKQAENLVNFMLGDLNDKLGEVHRLDILQAVDDKAMAYFASLPTKDVTDAALAQRVTALEKIGSVRVDQGQIPTALESYQAASTLAWELLQHAPNDVAFQAAYADSLKWVGQAYWYQGDLNQALQNFQQASVLLQKAVAARPDDSDLNFKLATVRNNIGHVLETRGDFAAAQLEYEATQKLYVTLSEREPANSKWQSYVGNAWNNLGKLALEQGKLGQAISSYRADQRIKENLAARDVANHAAQENLLVSNAILGRTLGLCGENDSGLRYTGAAVDSAKALMAFDPTYTSWQEYFALYSQQLGGLLRQREQYDVAEAAVSDAVRMLSGLTAKDPANSDWRQELAQSLLESARLKMDQGQTAAARESVDAASNGISELRAKNAADRRLILLAAQAYTVLGEIAAKGGNTNAARSFWTQARDLIAPTLLAGDDPSFLAASASALLRLDEVDAAHPLIAKLAAMGYRTPDFDALLAAKHIDYVVDADVVRRIADTMK